MTPTHLIAGIIELTPSDFGDGCVDDSSLDHLLNSLARHASLAEDDDLGDSTSRWTMHNDGAYFDARVTLSADLGQLMEQLDAEYFELLSRCDL